MHGDAPARQTTVAVVLVVHNGVRWLPTLLQSLPAALAAAVPLHIGGAHRPDETSADFTVADEGPGVFPEPRTGGGHSADARDADDGPGDAGTIDCDVTLIAVDTGSVDASADLARDAGFTVLQAEASTPFGRAVAIARAHLDSIGHRPEWLWLVHDDAAPQPGCLPALAAAAVDCEAAVAGPMVVQWSGSGRIAELGIRLTGAGRRVTSVDPGEVDQGQHDDDGARRTLAVGSTAMLVRTDVWDQLGGFDPALPMSGDDIDFCRRVGRAGHAVVAVPRAKVRHAGAMSRGQRPHSRSTRPARDLRLSALHMQIAHAAGWVWPFVAVRMLLGTFAAAAVALLRRDVIRARDEVDGLLRFLAHPSRVFASRHRVAATAITGPQAERQFRVPVRERVRVAGRSALNLADFVTRVAGERQEAPIFLEEDDQEPRPVRREVLRRLWHRPLIAVPMLLALVSAVAHFGLLVGQGPLHGALWPLTADSGGDLWRSYTSAWHDLGRGSAVPAPAWLLPTAVLTVPFGGSLSALLSFITVFFVPLFVSSFAVGVRGLVRGAWPRVIAGLCVALVPTLTTARDRADVSVLMVALLLPLLARSSVIALASPSAARWARVALLLSLAAAFEPMAWVLAAGIAVVMAGVSRQVRRAGRSVLVVLASPLVLLAPMSLQWLRSPQLLLVSTGAIPTQSPAAGAWKQVLTLSDSPGQWWGAAVAALGAAAMVRGASHRFTRDLGLAALIPLSAVVVADHVVVRIPGLIEPAHPAANVALTLIALAAGVSIATAADGLIGALRSHAVGPRHAAAIAAVSGVAIATVMGGWTWLRSPDFTLARGMTQDLPAFVAADLDSAEKPRVLVLRADDPAPIAFAIRGSATSMVGEDDMLRMGGQDAAVSAAVRMLVTQGELVAGDRAVAVRSLADAGIRYIAMPADGRGAGAVAQSLVSAPRIRQLTAPQDGRGWWLWQVPGKPARARIASVVDPQTALPWPVFSVRGDHDPGGVHLTATESGSTAEPLLRPSVIAIADATSGWSAAVDGRAADIMRTDSGTVLVDVPLGARSEVSIEHTDRSRSLWLLFQGLAIGAVCIAALPGRRRDDDEVANP
ncbi:MAG: glycosyltransferase [Actinomycetales bacterium]|nr:glycosyltransferase [Actinomycetales bacterium]